MAISPDWVLGFAVEVWWSRLAQPALHVWTDPAQPVQLIELTNSSDDPDSKALICYGLLLRQQERPTLPRDEMWLRFVKGRPVSAISTQFLTWCCSQVEAQGKSALLLVWDNATWHRSRLVRDWVRAHNRQVKRSKQGVRILLCFLPTKSPWLNPIEPKWVHGKRALVEPARLLSAQELESRVCAYFGCAQQAHLSIPEKVS